MIEADIAEFTYLGSHEPSIRDIKCIIPNRTLALVSGDNGSGKSTLALALGGLIPVLVKGRFRGSVTWRKQPFSLRNLPTTTSFVFQYPYIYFSGLTVKDELTYIESSCAGDFLPNFELDLSLHRLSSGEQQRLAISSALSRKNPVIILDEPFEYLDQTARLEAHRLFRLKVEKDDCTIIVIDRPSDDAPMLYDRKVTICSGTTTESHLPSEIGPLEPLPRPRDEIFFTVVDLSYSYPRSSRILLDRVSLTIRKGESLGIVGPNGVGKTTLLLLLAGLIKANSGGMILGKKEVTSRQLRRISKLSFSNPDNQIFGSTVRQELEFGMRNVGFAESLVESQLSAAARSLPFHLGTDPFSLSFGQKKLLSIVATILLRPSIAIFDEPTASLDAANVKRVDLLIREFLEAGNCVIVASHDHRFIRSACHSMLDISRFSG